MKNLAFALTALLATGLQAENQKVIFKALEPVKVEVVSSSGESTGEKLTVPKGAYISPVVLNNLAESETRMGEKESRQVRELWMAFTSANMERTMAGLPEVWPTSNLSDDPNDISGHKYKSAGEYFATLFDLKNTGTKKHKPYVNHDSRSISFTGKSIDLIVIGNYDCTWDDFIPVLVSANVDPKYLKASYNGENANEVIPIGSKVGRKLIPWANDFVIVCRKGGSVDVIKAKYFTYKNLYKGHTFNIEGLTYLDVADGTGFVTTSDEAQIRAAMSEVATIKEAALCYYLSNKKQPTNLKQLVVKEGGDPFLEGGEKRLFDPWGNPYQMKSTGKKVSITSAGPDGKFGTEDDISTK